MNMKNFGIAALGLLLAMIGASGAQAQCSGQFRTGQVCGYVGVNPLGLPGAVLLTPGIFQPIAGGTVIGNPSGSPAAPSATAAPVLGRPGNLQGSLGFAGVTGGTAILRAQAAAGTPTLLLPNTSGTLASGAAGALVLDAATGQLTCPTCATTTNGGALTAASPISINSAGLISITSPLPLANGGTNATSAPTARTSLGLGTISTQDANNVAITGGAVSCVVSPATATDCANKSYVDSLASGYHPVSPTKYASAAVLPNTPTYSNGASGVGATLTAGSNAAIVVDGASPALNDRVLVKDQASTLQNGIYSVTTVGSGAAAWVLTRATDFDQSSEMLAGSNVLVQAGTVNVGSTWALNATTTTVGTTPVVWTQTTQSNTGVLALGGNTGTIAIDAATLKFTAGPTLAVNTGTSGAVIGLLNASKTDSGSNTFSGANLFTGSAAFGNGSGQVITTFNGGNSGATGGSALLFQYAGANATAIGGQSAITGGGYSNDLTLYGGTTTNNVMWFYTGGVQRFDLNANGGLFLQPNQYLNFGGSSSSVAGYGIRDNAGAMEAKSSGGSWAPIPNILGWTASGATGGCNVGGGTVKPCQGIVNQSLNIDTVGTTYNNAGALGLYTDFRTIGTNPGGCCFAAAVQYVKLDTGGAGASETVFPAGVFIELNARSGTKTESSGLSVNVLRTGNGQGGTDGYEQGIAMQFFENGGQNNSRPYQGMEIDIFGDGIQPNVFGISIYALDGKGHGFHGNTAFYAGGGTGGTAWDWGFRATGNLTYAAYDSSAATITNSRSLKMARGQVIEMDPRAYLYFNNATSQLIVNIDGFNYVIKP